MKRLSAVLLLVLLTACGSRVAPEDRPVIAAQGGIRTAGTAERPGSGLSDPVVPADAVGSRDKVQAGGSSAEKLSADFFKPKAEGDFDLTISVKPLCVTPGSTGVATIETEPALGLGLMISYADKDVAGPHGFGTTDTTGRYDWAFAIPADAPVGPSEVLVGAVDWQTGKGVTGRTGFTIAAAC